MSRSIPSSVPAFRIAHGPSPAKRRTVRPFIVIRTLSLLNVAGGTAVLSKIKPISVTKLLPGHPDPEQVKGRLVTLEFEGCFVVCTYVTNAGQNLKVLQLVLPLASFDERYKHRHSRKRTCGTSTSLPIYVIWTKRNL